VSLLVAAAALTGYLIDARGGVSIYRRNFTKPSPAAVGVELHSGDTIVVSKDASAQVLCPNLLTAWEPVPQTSSGVFEGCPAAPEPTRMRDEQQVLGVRADEGVVNVLAPSNTVVASREPLIRWERVPGADEYRVSILIASTRRVVWGPALVEGTETHYGGKPPLDPGVRYAVRVTAGGAVGEGAPFTVATEGMLASRNERQKQLATAIRGRGARELAIAIDLLHHGFRSEALRRLEELTPSIGSAAVWLLYARCLGDIGATHAEYEALRRSADAAERQQDSFTEAEALQAMARMSKPEEASTLMDRAHQLLRKLGERSTGGR